jgi:hypothetical protein
LVMIQKRHLQGLKRFRFPHQQLKSHLWSPPKAPACHSRESGQTNHQAQEWGACSNAIPIQWKWIGTDDTKR